MGIDLSSDPLFKQLSQAGTNQVMNIDENQRQAMEEGTAGRGLSRSGFAAQAENQMTYKEQGDVANVNAQATNEVLQYRQQQEEIQLQQQELKYMKKKAKKAWIGTALSVVGAVVGTIICPGLGTMAGAMLGGLAGGAIEGGGKGGGGFGL